MVVEGGAKVGSVVFSVAGVLMLVVYLIVGVSVGVYSSFCIALKIDIVQQNRCDLNYVYIYINRK